ncbi:L-threonylcarbamoyladenylate synthase [Maritalea porphyrae]|uniref:L-threonylcarbamoyladenylate synthase n=1 Tax=Maritalea porphyrae TaxID=880732 RepID=UPI0022B0770A|nr:L-threonylcarbamoyladenylate synthase [Maritalea porphyrae]MCZ4271314.1 L-threonylcarbamoyladenylate synthase [Maritalea porphyrae]
MNERHLYPNPVSVNEAVEHLHNGDVVGMPTETVYGLAGLASNDDAVLKIFQTKGRPRFNPLIVHCADMTMAREIAEFDPLALKVANAFWPGPLTLVLPIKANARISDLVTAGLDTVAIRLPKHPMARRLLSTLGQPVAAPSANPSGKLSPTKAQHVIDAFGGAVPVLDGGACEAGVESTILAIENNRIILLRPGNVTAEMVESEIGIKVNLPDSGKIVAPGMLKSHYAPNAKVRLNAISPNSGEAFLGFGSAAFDGPNCRNLSPKADLAEAAKNLFQYLRELDAMGVATIAVAPIPIEGIGIAINDRLARAAADRTT